MPPLTEEEKKKKEEKKEKEDGMYTDILTALESGHCCLFLGPEIRCLLNSSNKSISVIEAFSDFIASEAQTEFEVSNFYYRANKFINENYKNKPHLFEKHIENFVNQKLNNIPDIFNQLVKLPFNSYLSMCPDEFISKALIANGYDFAEDFYDFNNQESHEAKMADEMRLVYYLYGKLSQPYSVPVTEKAQLHLVKNLVAEEPPIPTQIKKRMSDLKKSFLFLGANFKDWQFRIILDALNIPKPALSIAHSIPSDQEVAFLTKEFYTENFGFNFIESDIHTFLDQLIELYVERNGAIDIKKKVVLDFHENDRSKFEECKNQLKLNGINQRVEFWDTDSVIGGQADKTTQLKDKLLTADIYIPFVSSYFLLDKKEQLINALQSKTQVIIIHTGTVGVSAIPHVSKAHVLPSRDIALSSIEPKDLNNCCFELAKTINAIVK